jgi:hypothetical protein
MLTAGLAFVFALIFAPWMLCHMEQIVLRLPAIMIDQRPHESVPQAVIALAIWSYAVVSGWMFFALRRRDVRELFAKKPHATNPVATI